MPSLRLAWLSVVRQPARTSLAILGIAATGALLFDMLLLSRGLVVSFRDLLDDSGFDVRVLSTDGVPFSGPQIADATETGAALAALSEVDVALPVRMVRAEVVSGGRTTNGGEPTDGVLGERGGLRLDFIGADAEARPLWRLIDGHTLASDALDGAAALMVNRNVAGALQLVPGSTLRLRGECAREPLAVPAVSFTVTAIVEFPFDGASDLTAAGSRADLRRMCGDLAGDSADVLLVASRWPAGPEEAAAAIRAARPDLHVVTNEGIVERFRQVAFSYFRQISAVLATVTLFFGFLLITVMLTVSVNQRLGEIATLRALGLSRSRIVAGVMWESALLVGLGGLLAIPFGAALSVWLDSILRAMPGVPVGVRFFVFEPLTLALHAGLLGVTALAAALYPVRLVAALPIAETLRREVIS